MIAVHYQILTRHKAECDGQAIVALGADQPWENWTKDNLLAERVDKWKLSMLATLTEHPVGYAIASRRERTVHLHHLIVGAQWRTVGIGTTLLQHILENAHRCAASKLTLKVHRQNTRAIRFYQQRGFTIESVEERNLLWMAMQVIHNECAQIQSDES